MTHLTSISFFQDDTSMSVLIIKTTKGHVNVGEIVDKIMKSLAR